MSGKSKVDISVNITAHREGLLLYKTLRSISAAVSHAELNGLKLEVNISLDNADSRTVDIAQNMSNVKAFDATVTIYPIQKGDLGASRNYLIDRSNGEYIAFFDGDDFFSENYLYQAFVHASQHKKPAVYSPEYMINFEGAHYLITKLDSNSANFNPINLFETNYFISQSFVHRQIYEELRYEPNTNGYGMEDWHWNTRVIAASYDFINIPHTFFFYRRKKTGGLLAGQVQNGAILRPTELFKPKVFARLPAPKEDVSSNHLLSVDTGNTSFSTTLKRGLKHYPKIYKYIQTQYTLHKSVYKGMQGRLSRGQKKKDALVEDLTTLIKSIPPRLLELGMNEKDIENWGALNQYEPMIRSSYDMQLYIPIATYPTSSRVSKTYYEFCSKYSDLDFEDVVLVPHLVAGGADLAAINLIKELSQKSNVLVITTIDVDSPWLSKVVGLSNVVCIEAKTDFEGMDETLRLTFILRIIQHWGVKRLSIVNSEIGYKLATQFGRALKDVGCRAYLHTYAFDMTDDGFLFNWIPNGLVDAYDGVDMYVTDSLVYKKQLEEIHGFSKEKVATLYLPMSTGIPKKKDYAKKSKILWASRVHSSKLIEVMAEVGRRLKERGIELHVYGAIDPEYQIDDRFKNLIEPHHNIIYHGPYDGFRSLPVDDYDMFLMTSKNEGMPNVILEAIMAGMFVVAPAVGGIPECITDSKNGLLVENKFDPQAYIDAVFSAYQKNLFEKRLSIEKAGAPILYRHSAQNYSDQVNSLMNLRQTN